MTIPTLPVHDFHQHLWPEAFVAALARRAEPPRLQGRTLELIGSRPYEVDLRAQCLEERLRRLDEDGIDVAVVSCQPTLGIELLPARERDELWAAYHEGVLELVAQADGRLHALAAEAALDGTVGACVGADRLAAALEELGPLLDELSRRDSVLFVHPGLAHDDPRLPPWWAACVDYTAQMQAAYAAWLARGAARWPQLRVVFAILAGGAPMQLERLRSRDVDVRPLLAPNLYLDTSSYGRGAFEVCLATHGPAQLVFGSDAPVLEPQVTLREVRGLGRTAENAVLRENPARVLG